MKIKQSKDNSGVKLSSVKVGQDFIYGGENYRRIKRMSGDNQGCPSLHLGNSTVSAFSFVENIVTLCEPKEPELVPFDSCKIGDVIGWDDIFFLIQYNRGTIDVSTGAYKNLAGFRVRHYPNATLDLEPGE